MLEDEPRLPGRLIESCPVLRVIHAGHIGESLAPERMVRADQGMCPHQVDVVINHHHGTRLEAGVDSARAVGEDNTLRPHHLGQTDREGNRPPSCSFVPMSAAGKNQQRNSAVFRQQDLSPMPRHAGRTQFRDRSKVDRVSHLESLSHLAPAGTHDQRQFGTKPSICISYFFRRR